MVFDDGSMVSRRGSLVRNAALLIVLFLLHGPAPDVEAAIDPRAEPVVHRILAATGGTEARATERTLHCTGRIQSIGLTGRWEMWLAAPDRWMRTMRLGSLTLRQGFDGEVAWRTDLAGKTVIVQSEAEARRARDEGWFLNERWALPDQGGGDIVAGSTAYGDAVTYETVVITPPGGEPRRLFVNAKTGFVERVSATIDRQPVEDRPGGYKMLAGRKRPTVYQSPTLLPTEKPVERMTVDSLRVNVAIDSAIFSPPELEARSIAWRKARGTMRVPFDYTSKTVIVKVSINGAAPADFILDTGASLSVVDAEFAHQIGLTTEGDAGVEGIAARAEMKFARVHSIALTGRGARGATLRDFRVAVLDFGGGEIGLWRKTHGLLGADFLSRFVVEIDYDSLVVSLHDPSGFRYAGKGSGIPFELSQGIPVVELSVNGGCAGKFMVDVGNAFQFVVHGSLVRPCGLMRQSRRREVEVLGGGVGGGFVGWMCRLDSLKIGPYGWTEPVAVLTLHTGGGIGSQEIGGNIGNSVLERFRCTFDYARRTLYLEPGRRYAERERVSRFGAQLARIGTRVVAGNILSGSAAYEAGLRWYDEIVAIDGRPLVRWSREEVDRTLERGPVGAVHRVTYRRLDESEKTVEVTLKDVL